MLFKYTLNDRGKVCAGLFVMNIQTNDRAPLFKDLLLFPA